jgi:hypothetical protein
MKPSLYVLTDAQHATVLAALRNLQNTPSYSIPSAIKDIATNGGTVTPLDDKAIDQLCEGLNHTGLSFGEVVNLLGEDESNPYVAGAAEHHLANEREFDGKVMVSDGGDDGAYVMCWLWVSDELAGVTPAEEPNE